MTDQHRRQLAIHGYNDLLAEHCELLDRVMVLETRLEQMAAELRRLGCTVGISVRWSDGWKAVVELPDEH